MDKKKEKTERVPICVNADCQHRDICNGCFDGKEFKNFVRIPAKRFISGTEVAKMYDSLLKETIKRGHTFNSLALEKVGFFHGKYYKVHVALKSL